MLENITGFLLLPSALLSSISLTETALCDMRQMSLSRSYYRDCLGSTFLDIQINLGGKNVLCIFTHRILIEAGTSAKTSLCKKLPCIYVGFIGVCLFAWWDTHRFSLLPLSTPLFCLSQNIVIAGSFTGRQSPSFEAGCWTEESPYCLHFSASHQSTHLPRLSMAEYLSTYSCI